MRFAGHRNNFRRLATQMSKVASNAHAVSSADARESARPRPGSAAGRGAISRLRTPADHELSADTRSLVARHHGDNWIRALALNPGTARRFTGYFEDLFAPTGRHLPLRERELIAVVVSATNGCGLCELHHARALGEVLDNHGRAQLIALDHHLADLSPRESALAALAAKVTLNPKAVSANDFDGLRATGFSDEEILEAIEVSAWFNHTNRMMISLAIRPDTKYFASGAGNR